jgi:hypothetical protein
MAITEITVEDGSIVSGANSYITEAELTQYAEDRAYTITADDNKTLIYKAMDFIESKNFLGKIVEEDQPLSWPRQKVYYRGFLLENTDIPQILKDAVCALALEIDRGYDPLAVITQAVKRQKVDVIEVEFQDGTSTFSIRSVNAILRPLLNPAGSVQRVL